jgi:hypothetical protein
MARQGRQFKHAWHCLQRDEKTGFSPSIVILEAGQILAQIPQPLHAAFTSKPFTKKGLMILKSDEVHIEKGRSGHTEFVFRRRRSPAISPVAFFCKPSRRCFVFSDGGQKWE